MILAETQSRRESFDSCLRVSAFLRENLRYAFLIILLSAGTAAAQEVSTSVVLKDLQRPCGIAARPAGTADRYELFIAESGAGRVVRWTNLKPDDIEAVIDGFSAASAERPSLQTGPLSVLFLDPGLVIVGISADDGHGLLRIFELPEHDEVLAANQPRERVSVGPDETACWALARTRANEFVHDRLVSIVRGPKQIGSLYKSRIQAGTLGAMQPFGNEDAEVQPSDVTAVTTSPTGRIVAVAKTGESGGEGSRLLFFNPIEGAVEVAMPLKLPQVIALAYSPTTPNLYAADFSGGIHRIDDTSRPGRPACRAVKIFDAQRPTALAFAPDGALYFTTFGDRSSTGTLEVATGDL